MKVTVELTSQEEIKAFYERMFNPDKPTIVFATPKAEDPEPQKLPDGFKPAPESVPFTAASDTAGSAPQPMMNVPETKIPTFKEVTDAALKWMDTGKQADLQALLQKFGVPALTYLKDSPDKLAEFYKELEAV